MRYLLPLFIFTLASCSTEIDSGKNGCADMQACTEIYKSIVLEIKDSKGNAYVLDTYNTTKVSTGSKVAVSGTVNDDQNKNTGQYPVFEDGNMSLTTEAGQEFEFTGSKGGKVVIRKTFTIGHDCCHIVLRKGETTAVINL